MMMMMQMQKAMADMQLAHQQQLDALRAQLENKAAVESAAATAAATAAAAAAAQEQERARIEQQRIADAQEQERRRAEQAMLLVQEQDRQRREAEAAEQEHQRQLAEQERQRQAEQERLRLEAEAAERKRQEEEAAAAAEAAQELQRQQWMEYYRNLEMQRQAEEQRRQYEAWMAEQAKAAEIAQLQEEIRKTEEIRRLEEEIAAVEAAKKKAAKEERARARRAKRQAELQAVESNIKALQIQKMKFALEQQEKAMQHQAEVEALNEALIKKAKDKKEMDELNKQMAEMKKQKMLMDADKNKKEADLLLLQKEADEREAQFRVFQEIQAQMAMAVVTLDLSPPDWSGNRDWPSWTSLEHISITLANPATAILQGAKADLSYVNSNLEFKFKKDPFAKGGVRLAYHCLMKNGMKKYVLKKIGSSAPHKTKDDALKSITKDSVRVQLLAKQATDEFMNRMRPTGALAGITCAYIGIEAVRDNTTSDWHYWTIEPLLEGTWDKFNDNAGGVLPTPPHNNLPQALSHFSYEYFSKRIILVDVQGTYDRNHYEFTDPAFHSVDTAFGPTDLGGSGIDEFFKTHTCGSMCQALRLPKHPAQK